MSQKSEKLSETIEALKEKLNFLQELKLISEEERAKMQNRITCLENDKTALSRTVEEIKIINEDL
jgi:hypothetical protein